MQPREAGHVGANLSDAALTRHRKSNDTDGLGNYFFFAAPGGMN